MTWLLRWYHINLKTKNTCGLSIILVSIASTVTLVSWWFCGYSEIKSELKFSFLYPFDGYKIFDFFYDFAKIQIPCLPRIPILLTAPPVSWNPEISWDIIWKMLSSSSIIPCKRNISSNMSSLWKPYCYNITNFFSINANSLGAYLKELVYHRILNFYIKPQILYATIFILWTEH